MIYQFTPKWLPSDCHAEQSEASLYRFFADAQNDRYEIRMTGSVKQNDR